MCYLIFQVLQCFVIIFAAVDPVTEPADNSVVSSNAVNPLPNVPPRVPSEDAITSLQHLIASNIEVICRPSRMQLHINKQLLQVGQPAIIM